MKLIILAAGDNSYPHFPRLWAKPKCLYSYQGKIQILRILENVRALGLEKDTRIVIGFKAEAIRTFLFKNNFKGEFVKNPDYSSSGIHSLRCGLRDINEEVCICCADQLLDLKYWRQLIETKNSFAIFNRLEDPHHFHIDCIKLGPSQLVNLRDDRYLSSEFITEAGSFLTDDQGQPLAGEVPPPSALKISSGVAIGYMLLDLIRRECGVIKVTEVVASSPHRVGIVTIPNAACTDLDHFRDTDEFRDNPLWRIAFPLEVLINRILRKLQKIVGGEAV